MKKPAVTMLSPSIAGPSAEDASPGASDVVAEWIFSEDYTVSGTSIEEGNLVIQDASGRGNDLKLVTAGNPAEMILSFTSDGALDFAYDPIKGRGQYLTTVDEAPINTETFETGFTIEAEFKLGEHFTSWMGMLTRRGSNPLEKEESLSTLSISNSREIQWASTPMSAAAVQTNWSDPLLQVKAWAQSDDYTYVAVVNDGATTRLYVNGVESIRNPDDDVVIRGIAAEAGMGWNVGAYEWDGAPSSMFSGAIKHIRVTGRALDPAEFFKREFNYHDDSGTNDDLPMFAPGTYTFAFIPDPQIVVKSKPGILEKQLEFIAEHFRSNHIAMTVNIGDSVHDGTAKEWSAADKAFKILDDAQVPYAVTRGNHDLRGTCYVDIMGPDRFAGTDYFKGASPSGLSTYSIITAGSYRYLFLGVDSVGNTESNSKEIHWAGTVLEANPNLPTVMFSHHVMTINDTGEVSEDGPGMILWNDLVNDHDQVFLMVGGHISGAGLNVKRNAKGRDVLQVLTDYQSHIAGGNGWTSFFEFDEHLNEIRLKTYSPYVASIPAENRSYLDKTFLTGPGDMYNIPFMFKERFACCE